MDVTAFNHLSVLPQETLSLLDIHPGDTVLDGTLGGGGHATLMLKASAPDGVLIGLDRDQDALHKAAQVLESFGERAILRHANFSEAGSVCNWALRGSMPCCWIWVFLPISWITLSADSHFVPMPLWICAWIEVPV